MIKKKIEYSRADIADKIKKLQTTNNISIAQELEEWYEFVFNELSAKRKGDFIKTIPVRIPAFPKKGKKVEARMKKCLGVLEDMAFMGEVPFEVLAQSAWIPKTGKVKHFDFAGQFNIGKLGHVFPPIGSNEVGKIVRCSMKDIILTALSKIVPTVKLLCYSTKSRYKRNSTECFLSMYPDVVREMLSNVSMSTLRKKLLSLPEITDNDFILYMHCSPEYYISQEHTLEDGSSIGLLNEVLYWEYNERVYEIARLSPQLIFSEEIDRIIVYILAGLIYENIEIEFEKAKYVQSDDWICMDIGGM